MVPRPLQVTLSPACIVTVDGENLKPETTTLVVAAKARPPVQNCTAIATIRARERFPIGRFTPYILIFIVLTVLLMSGRRHRFRKLWQPQSERCHDGMSFVIVYAGVRSIGVIVKY